MIVMDHIDIFPFFKCNSELLWWVNLFTGLSFPKQTDLVPIKLSPKVMKNVCSAGLVQAKYFGHDRESAIMFEFLERFTRL